MYTNILLHIVFGTKDYQKSITPELKEVLYPYLQDVIKEQRGKGCYINGTEDHIHLLVSVSPTKSVADLVRLLKDNSAKYGKIKKLSGTTFEWQAGYGAFSVSYADRDDVIKYLSAQEEYHRKVTYEQEFGELLGDYGIQYDPKYLFK